MGQKVNPIGFRLGINTEIITSKKISLPNWERKKLKRTLGSQLKQFMQVQGPNQ